MTSASSSWPALPYEPWRDTYATVHMWTQIVGKVRMALTPPVNHWWHVPLYVTSRGLETTPIPYEGRTFEVTFDFVDHALKVVSNDGRSDGFALKPCAVADFYGEFMATLRRLDIAVRIWPVPVEVPAPIPFTEDRQHAAYDRDQVRRCWDILVQADAVFKEFRGRFIGKCSPVHFFWGAFDLAVTRFSGRPVPPRGDLDPVNREAYSHEVISHGFWPGGAWAGGGVFEAPMFYSYTVPEPAGLRQAAVQPAKAYFDDKLGEFVLPYDDLRTAHAPRAVLLDFMESTYDAGATLARWDRKALER